MDFFEDFKWWHIVLLVLLLPILAPLIILGLIMVWIGLTDVNDD